MKRLLLLVVLGGAGLMLTPAVASAQFGMPYGIRYQQRNFFMGPSTTPFYFTPRYVTSTSMRISTPIPTIFGSTSINLSRTLVTNRVPSAYAATAYAPYALSIPYVSYSLYGQTGSYITGAANSHSDFVYNQQRDIAKAQREYSLLNSQSEIAGQWNYEKGNAPMLDINPLPDPLRVALAPTDPAMVTSGKVHNTLLKEIARVEAKGAKGPSAYIPPLLLEDVRFGGSPAADLLNLAREAGALEFPVAFDDPALATLRGNLEKDFAAVAAAVRAGKAPDPDKVTKLENTFQKVQDALGPVIKNLPFEDATAARKFLNQMTNAIRAMKTNAANGLIDPKWEAEGLTVADLVKHMTKHKLQFGPAPRGGEEAYATMHRNLATYLFVLNQPKK
jgi:hypothetical protein